MSALGKPILHGMVATKGMVSTETKLLKFLNFKLDNYLNNGYTLI